MTSTAEMLAAMQKMQTIFEEQPIPKKFTLWVSDTEWLTFQASLSSYEIISESSPRAIELLKEKLDHYNQSKDNGSRSATQG